ncbi:DciA family protein [Ornithinimicrobium sp. Arc0846-15]|nr:DciA family protein [Ornithinimicrobium laminariae]
MSGDDQDRAQTPEPDSDDLDAAREALARARKQARERGYRPGAAGRAPKKEASGLGEQRGAKHDPNAREPQTMGNEMRRLFSHRGWKVDVQVGSVIGRWPSIVGPQVSAHIEPISFEGTVLTVLADSTAWATQMKLLQSSILTRIDAEVGPGIVTEIIVKGPGGPSWKKGRLRSSGPGPRDTYG